MVLTAAILILAALYLWAAPPTTARGTPGPNGIKLPDGFKTTIAFALNSTVRFWEKTPKPPGVDGGEPIDQTTMLSTAWREMHPRSLKTLMPSTFKAAYDPAVYTDALTLINAPGGITVHFPDGSTLDFWGYLQKIEPDNMEEGKQPEASITIVPTNFDPANHVEQGPVLTSVAGT